MQGSLMGTGSVVESWRYLGVTVAAREMVSEHVPAAGEWSEPCECLIARLTWERHVDKVERRVSVLMTNPSSTGFRAGCWNTYVASCLPFLAQLVLAPKEAERRLRACYARTFALQGWCPAPFLAGLAIKWGAPRRTPLSAKCSARCCGGCTASWRGMGLCCNERGPASLLAKGR